MQPRPWDVVVIGAGPAGSAVARLLADWGHSALVLGRLTPDEHGLAESIPPSAKKLLARVGVLEAIERRRFYPNSGNTTWWASPLPSVETFQDPGYQVYRPAFDRVLRRCASTAGAVVTDARVTRVRLDGEGARVDFGSADPATARFVLDCSGRTAVLGRRFRRPEPGHRMCALVATYDRIHWDLPDPTHTLVEAYADGWAWSIPISRKVRHIGFMVDRGSSGSSRARRYRAELGKTRQIRRLVDGARWSGDVWACNASTYRSTTHCGPRFLLVGDAGSFIDPLSSFGIKKALASAWMAAIVVHTCLKYPDRAPQALALFDEREREVYAVHAERSSNFARAAYEVHPGEFWASRAGEPHQSSKGSGLDDAEPREAEIRRAFEQLKSTNSIRLTLAGDVRFEKRPVIRGREIVLEDALAGGARFYQNVDLVRLAAMAGHLGAVADVYEAYCRRCSPTPLPNVMGGLSWLLAKGILQAASI